MIVEPHADDAYLSLHHHIKRWVKTDIVVIVTVFGGTRKRKEDAIRYADSVGAIAEVLPNVEGGPIADVNRQNLVPVNFDEEQEVEWYFPLGIQHPEHKEVRLIGDDFASPNFYAEIPYYGKKINEEDFINQQTGLSLISCTTGTALKGDEKYWKCFKDQSKFFFYNPPAGWMKTPELIFTFIER
jgi:hypothetical protein